MATSEDWIGKQIGKQVVCSWVGGGGVRGELVEVRAAVLRFTAEVSDRGVVLNASVAHAPSVMLFCPWAGVRAIQLAGPEAGPSDIGDVVL